MRDALLFGILVFSFALTITAHLAILMGLTSRLVHTRRERLASPQTVVDDPRYAYQNPTRAIVLAWLIPVLVPIWGFSSGMKGRVILWLLGVLVYATSRVLCAH